MCTAVQQVGQLLNEAKGQAKDDLEWLASRDMVPDFINLSNVFSVQVIPNRNMLLELADFLSSLSVSEVNDYLLAETVRLQQNSRYRGPVSGTGRYVVYKKDSSVGYSYITAEDYCYPPGIMLPTQNQLTQEWGWKFPYEVHRSLQDSLHIIFMKEKIVNSLYELRRYQELLKGEFISFEYAFISPERFSIHADLMYFADAVVKNAESEEYRLRREGAPSFMLEEAVRQRMQAEEALNDLNVRGVNMGK